jgi:uncharacterized repeat protein (TIGR03803 family)
MKRAFGFMNACLSASLLTACGSGASVSPPIATAEQPSSNAGLSAVQSPEWRNKNTQHRELPTEAVIYHFQDGTDGGLPAAGLIMDKAGVLYGTTTAGNSGGNVYALTPNGSTYNESAIYTLGGAPEAPLIADSSGGFYSTTLNGGTDGVGIVFKLTHSGTTWIESILHSFVGGRDGANPIYGGLLDSSGTLYGTTYHGGHTNCASGGCGTVFELRSSHEGYRERILYRFRGGSDGENPSSTLVMDKTGALFGTTSGGALGLGTVFKLTRYGNRYKESVVHHFRGGRDGAYPIAGLIAGPNGDLYGTTYGGGGCGNPPSGCGTVFLLTGSGRSYVERILYRFQGGKDGANPYDGLIADSTGAFYGTSANGGSSCGGGCGTVFRLMPSGKRYHEDVIYSFQGGSDGRSPFGGVLIDSAGALYGTTFLGGGSGCGGNGCGTAFKIKGALTRETLGNAATTRE